MRNSGATVPRLDGKHIVVTGGSTGIGFEVSREALKVGANVCFCARNPVGIEGALSKLSCEGFGPERVRGFSADVSSHEQVQQLFVEAERSFGPLNGLAHAAAVMGPIGPVIEIEPEEWLDALRIDLFGTFLVAREAARRMAEGQNGRMVLFSGGGASGPFENYTAYACSKVAVVRFTETLAQELSFRSIEVNCIAPGFVATRIHDATIQAGANAGRAYLQRTKDELAKGGTPPSVAAKAATFLLSDSARGISGKFVSAVHDGWLEWPEHLAELQESEIFTLRRILPRDRGMNWQ